MDDFEQILLAIAGVGPARMRSLFEAGFDSAEKLGSANDEELSQVTGISRKLAQRIHDSFAPADPSQKKEPETNLFLCPSCGAFISLGAEKCEICGIEFEEEEDELAEEQVEVGEDEEAQRLSEELEADARDVENGQAEGDEDGFWYKKREKDLFLCPNCGAFIAEGEPKCHICGVEFSEEEESIEDVEQAMEDEADQVRRAQEEQALREEGVDGFWYKEKQKGLFLCPDCGAFISEGVTHCEICGIEFETEAEEEAEVLELPIEKEGLAEEGVDGFWYKQRDAAPEEVVAKAIGVDGDAASLQVDGIPPADGQSLDEELMGGGELDICIVCGAFVSPGAEACPICGAAMVEEETVEEKQEKSKVASDFLKRWEKLTSQSEMSTLTPYKGSSRKELEEGIIYYDHLLEVDPTLLQAWESKARFLRKAGRYEEALECYNRAAELRKDDPNAYREEISEVLGESLGLGELELPVQVEAQPQEEEIEAIERTLETYEKLLDEDPSRSRVWQLKGELLEKLGRNEDALLAYDHAIETGDQMGRARAMREKLVRQLVGADSTRGLTNGLALRGSEAVISGGFTNGLTTAGITNGTTNGRINGRINGMTNGRVNGLLAIGGRINGRGMVNGNGLTNGRGVINGRGLINGVGRVNGRGMVNGNGLINGIGRVNGRGLINGLGRTNGNGLINGLGRINGNGLINGLGMVNGRGLVNGNGLINGLGKFYKPRRRSSDLGWARSTVGLGIALVLLMVLPGLVTIMYTVPPAPGITIDGEFADWSGTPIFRDSRSDFLDPNLDLEEYGIYNDRSTVSFYAKVSGTFFGAEGEMAHALLVLIDSDGDPETGYSFNSLGVDTYFIISGYDGEARRISQYVFNNSQGQDAWSGFRSTNTRAEFSSRGSEFELKTSANGIPIYSRDGARFAMATIDTLRQGDVSDTPFGEGTPALRVESRTLAPSIVNPGDVDVPLLYMNVRATSENATLATIFFSHRGVGGLETLALYEDTDRSQTLTALDRTIPTIISYGERSITMELITPVHLLAGQEYSFSIAATINNQAQPETLVSVTPAQNPISGAVSFLKHSSSGNTYVLSPPGRIAIDGAFGDWDDISPVEDAVGDVEGGPNHNVDLAQTRLALDDQHMSFFLQVEGLLFAGEDLLFTPARPEERPPPEPPVEPVDPPEPPEPPVDPPTPVVRPVPYISGEDLALLFLDVDGNISTGFNQMDIGIGADYLVAVRGREGVVKNATLMSFNPSDLDEPWAILGEVEVGKDDRRMETQIPSSILVPGIHPLVQVRLIAWNESRDGTDFPITSPYLPTRSNEETYGARSATRSGGVETKNLYLRTGNQLSTFVGGALATTQISAGSSVTWTQTPAMSGDFNITGTVSTILHLTPANAGNNRPSATVTLGYGATTLGSSTISPIPSTGWYTFNIPATATIPAGNTIWARIAVTGANQNVRATVSYNSQTYNSRIDIPTDTYINVEWVRTYNEGVETNNFQPEETVEIRANITDPLGIQDISSVTATVYYPNGTILASNLAMAIYQSDPGNFWRTYNATAPLPSDAPGGVYLVEITATETNGVLSHGEHRFFSPVERGVMLYPDSTLEGSAGGSVTFSLSLQNIGVEAEDILLFPGSSSMGWRSELVAGGSVVAYDSDGDGVWDWIDGAYSSGGAVLLSLDSQEVVLVSLRKLIPSGVSGVVDVTSIRAQMSGNSSIFDDATLTTMVPAPGVLKSLYLRGGSALSTIPGAATATTAIANGGSASWVQSPILAGNFAITGTVSVVLYISTTTHGINQASVTASLRYDGVLLGSHTIAGMTTAGWYTFPISATGTLAGGEALSLEVSTAIRPITVYYNSPEYPSRIDIPTNTYTRVQWTKAYNVSAETNSFVAGEQVEIRANVTDPLGQQDIDYAQITITYPDGTPLTTNTIMSTLQTDPANYWRLFNHIFTMPADAPVGTYNYTVTAYETDGANHNLTRSFVVPCGVSVGPDLNITGYENTTLNYTQWINNTGKGADVYNLFVNSVRGWNVSIWSGGVLMAYDSNGDGAWEYVNPAFDTSGDGNPDTGLLLPGDGIQVHVSLQIPLGVEGSDAVALTAVSIGGVCSDTATAIIQVVEIPFSSQEWFIIIALPLFMAYNRVSKGRNRSKLKKTDVANGPDPESIH